MPITTMPLDEAPSGLPDGADEKEPMGVPEAAPDEEAPDAADEGLPGIPAEGEEPDTAG